MERIGIRELRQQASRYLSRVESGESFEITDRGRLVAVLSPPSPAQGARNRLIAAGRLVPARAPAQFPAPVRLDDAPSSADVLADIRADRS